jgi:hypothetical protein
LKDFLSIFKKLSLIFQREDLMLTHVKVHVEIALYASEKAEVTAGPVQKNIFEIFQ